MKAKTETLGNYEVTPPATASRDIVAQALAFLDAEMRNDGALFTNPQAVKDFLICHNGRHEDQFVERFSVVFLDSQNRMIECETMFTGTLTQTSVYPREVARKALKHNASGIILSHNHPSGALQPSRADETLTHTIKAALALVDVRTLDHIITSGGKAASMAEMGLM